MTISYKSKFGQINDQAQTINGIKTFPDEIRVGFEDIFETPLGYSSRFDSRAFHYLSNGSSFGRWSHGTGGSSPVSQNIVTVDFTSTAPGNNGDQFSIHGVFNYSQNTGPAAAIYSFSACLIGSTPTVAATVDLVKNITGAPTAPTIAWSGAGTTRTLAITSNATFTALSGWFMHSQRNSSGGVVVTINSSFLVF